jgi:hypothetical protein
MSFLEHGQTSASECSASGAVLTLVENPYRFSGMLEPSMSFGEKDDKPFKLQPSDLPPPFFPPHPTNTNTNTFSSRISTSSQILKSTLQDFNYL